MTKHDVLAYRHLLGGSAVAVELSWSDGRRQQTACLPKANWLFVPQQLTKGERNGGGARVGEVAVKRPRAATLAN